MASCPDIAVVIPSYNGVARLSALFSSIAEHDPSAFDQAPFHIFEDPCGFAGVSRAYDILSGLFPISVRHLPTWSNMHGAAQAAFEQTPAKWLVYLGDDVLVTPGALSNLFFFLRANELETVAAVQIPYWNAHELTRENFSERQGPVLLGSKDDMYNQGLEWLLRVPQNPHWNGEGYARPYVNVNGVGFAARRDTWEAVGGFCRDTWCLDESLSVRIWLKSNQSIVCLPGPPFVHYFAGATLASPPAHSLHTEEAWIRGMKMTKAEAGRLSYEKMFEREPACLEEMRRANYFDGSLLA